MRVAVHVLIAYFYFSIFTFFFPIKYYSVSSAIHLSIYQHISLKFYTCKAIMTTMIHLFFVFSIRVYEILLNNDKKQYFFYRSTSNIINFVYMDSIWTENQNIYLNGLPFLIEQYLILKKNYTCTEIEIRKNSCTTIVIIRIKIMLIELFND